jgi:hypothetical protein
MQVKQIKNGFYDFQNDGEYRDLKLFLEVYNKQCDVVTTVEIQCSTKRMFQFKATEHVFYDYTRAEGSLMTFE